MEILENTSIYRMNKREDMVRQEEEAEFRKQEEDLQYIMNGYPTELYG